VGILQLVAHEAGKCIVCHEGSSVLFPNDFGEDFSTDAGISFKILWRREISYSEHILVEYSELGATLC